VRDHGARFEIFTADLRGRSGQAWIHDPAEHLWFRRGDLRHPEWCDPQHCGALQPLVSHHRGIPAVLEPRRADDPTITVQLWMDAHEPIETAHTSVVLTVDHTMIAGVPDVRGYNLEAWQVSALLAALAPMDTILRARGGGA
jgi:hypothetical protein